MVILSDYFKEITINQDYIESIEVLEDLCNEHAIEFLRRHNVENPEEMIAQYNDHIFNDQKIYIGCSAIIVPITLPREILQNILQNDNQIKDANGNVVNSDVVNSDNGQENKENQIISDENLDGEVSLVEQNVEQTQVEYSETTESAVILTQQNPSLLNTTIGYKATHQTVVSQNIFMNLLSVKNSSVVGEDYRIINNIFIIFKPTPTEEEAKASKQNSQVLMLIARIQKLLWYTPFTFQMQKKNSPEEILDLIHKYEELLIA